jgi:hypothetical protein
MPRSVVLGALALVVVAMAGSAAPLFARTSNVMPYPMVDVWPAAVRYLRVDRGATIREKDAEAGYVLFDLTDANKQWKGALELVRAVDGEGREATRVVVTLPDLPRHYEITLLDKLGYKLREELGSPAPPPPRRPDNADRPARPTPDAGTLPRPPTREQLPRAGGGP